jgi:hypothetical protein
MVDETGHRTLRKTARRLMARSVRRRPLRSKSHRAQMQWNQRERALAVAIDRRRPRRGRIGMILCAT